MCKTFLASYLPDFRRDIQEAVAVEQWIKGLQTKPRGENEKPRDLAPKSKLHTRGGEAHTVSLLAGSEAQR